MIEQTAALKAWPEMVKLITTTCLSDKTARGRDIGHRQRHHASDEGAALNVHGARQLEWFQSEVLVDADITLETLIDNVRFFRPTPHRRLPRVPFAQT